MRLGILDAAKETGSEIVIDDKLPKELNDMAATLAKLKLLSQMFWLFLVILKVH